MLRKEGFPVGVACAAVGLPRSSFYYRPREREELGLKEAIQEIAAQYPTYGSRRITAQLRREPYRFQVNRKRVQRLMRELGLVVERKRKKVATTDSRHHHRCFPNLMSGLHVRRPDQVWVADITYIRLKDGFVYLAVVMDVFTRGIRGWGLSRSLDHGLTMEALEMALGMGIPEIHHSDRGVQYAAGTYVGVLSAHDVEISMAEAGRPEQNGYAERVMRTIKEEEVELNEYEDFWDAKGRIGEFIEEVYQKKRIHSALGYLTPEEFEEKWYRERETFASLSKDSRKPVQLLGSTTHHHMPPHPRLSPVVDRLQNP
jgi:transposase InsO family protein